LRISSLARRRSADATVPTLRIVPDVPMTRSNPADVMSRRYFASSSPMCRTSFRSSRFDIGSVWTNRSVSLMTPTLKLLAARSEAPAPWVISTLPPPMSTTTTDAPATSTP
jgi:hypothetical protein